MDHITFKKIKYESSRRGMKELDLILGKFFNEMSNAFSYTESNEYAQFLKQEDSDIYSWLMGNDFPPIEFKKIVLKIRTYCDLD
ncbi:MAG: hypothetical protein HEEMFOPI_00185 [Holosporales bacterium]